MKVKQIDKKTGDIIKIYDYVRLVKHDGYIPATVINCCNKKKNFNSHFGFLWEWIE